MLRCAGLLVLTVLPLSARGESPLTFIGPDARSASSKAVVVKGTPTLGHTSQLLPLDTRGQLVGKDRPAAQIERLLNILLDIVARPDSLVKLNVYVRRTELAEQFTKALAARLPKEARPAVSFVTTALPHADALIALDAVFVSGEPSEVVRRHEIAGLPGHPGTIRLALLPHGKRVYVAGQAEKGDDLADATRKTLDSLRTTLKHLRLSDAHVVQVKAFLTPMSDAAVVERTVAEFYGKMAPAMIFVEWKASKAAPIEIELIAYGGPEYVSAPDVVEYITPPMPNLPSSPIFSRVCRVNYGPSIYLSGIYSGKADDATVETQDVLDQLKEVMKSAGSDLKHLVKATYYVSSEETSKALNQLRPRYYDPKRPPSASKALVAGVARPDRALMIDMIAVPTMKVPETPPEVGHGLTAAEAAEGWISLFDGTTTFGWSNGLVEKNVLVRGTTSMTFGVCAVKAEIVAAGTLTLGGRIVNVQPGRFTRDSTVNDGAVTLGDGVKLKSLAIRPLGMKALFDGKSLSGWKRIDRATIPEERRPHWRVENGAIAATGGPGALESAEKYDNLVLQIDVRTRTRHANGGVFFRSIPGDFMNGYEAQVYNRCRDGDPSKPVEWATGGIDDRQNARRLVSRDFHYYRMTVIAREAHLATWINGYQVTDWIDTRAIHENPRRGRRTEPGTIQLQAHDPLTDVEFKNIQIGK